MTTFTLTGLSGRKYAFNVCYEGGGWNAVPGLYIFADSNGWPKYVGETESFLSRNPGPSHECWERARSHGASLILAALFRGPAFERLGAEADLIRAYDPPVNKQMRLRPVSHLARALLGAPSRAHRRTLLGGG